MKNESLRMKNNKVISMIKNMWGRRPSTPFSFFILSFSFFISCAACKVSYKLKDVSIDPNAKTAYVKYIENRARFVNPQLSPQLTNKLREKINNQTRLTLMQEDAGADYYIECEITGYDVTTSGISNQEASTNRLIVTVNVIFKNKLDDKKSFETPVSRNFDFSASKSLDQAQAELTPTIIQNMVDEIFNKVFSNW
jgi:hypothetical protein